MEPFRQRRRIEHTNHKAFKHHAEFFQPSLPQPFAPKESVFSFKRFIDRFSSMCELITLPETTFLRRMQKILCGRVVMKRKLHVSL